VSVLLLTGAGVGMVWWQQRSAAVRVAEGDISKALEMRAEGKWKEALALLDRTRERLASAGLPEMERRLEQVRQETAFLVALEEAREQRSMVVDDSFDYKGGSEAYARAFEAYGRDVTTGTEAEAAAWIKGFPEEVREAALIALHDWWAYAPQAELSARLLKIAERADDDPWRRRLREAVRTKDLGLLLGLTREARARPLPAASYSLLADLVRGRKKEEAVDLLRRARLLHPRDFWIPHDLGHLLHDFRGPPPGAAELEEAAGCWRTALAIRPESATALISLGITLKAQGKLTEAVAACQQAIRLKPDVPAAYNNLGAALAAQGKLPEAVAACQQAIRLKPDLVEHHFNLGLALRAQGNPAAAVAAYQKAIDLKPDYADAHYCLGNALGVLGKRADAIAHFREAIRFKPNYPEAYCNLGYALRDEGKFAESLDMLRRGHELGAKTPGWPYPSAQWVRDAERLLALNGPTSPPAPSGSRPASPPTGPRR
jgi:tetratricopeptide (TPR) repeat protein